MSAYFGALTWRRLPQRSLIPGQMQLLNHSVGAVLQSNSDPTTYRIFDPALTDSALVGAELRGSGAIQFDDVQISADSATVRWSRYRSTDVHVPGIYVHASARVHSVNSRAGGNDTLWLRLPALGAMGATQHMIPRISFNASTPRSGETVLLAAMRWARLPYLLLAVFMVLIDITLVALLIRQKFPEVLRFRVATTNAPATTHVKRHRRRGH